jgi:hypothetical protein
MLENGASSLLFSLVVRVCLLQGLLLARVYV